MAPVAKSITAKCAPNLRGGVGVGEGGNRRGEESGETPIKATEFLHLCSWDMERAVHGCGLCSRV